MRTSFFPPFPVFLASVYILFTASSPEFSWKCSVFSTRILWLSNRVLRHNIPEQRWKRTAGQDWQTGTQRLVRMKEGEKEMKMERWGPNFSTCTWKLSPKCHRKCIFGFQRSCGVTCTCSALLCSDLRLMSYISHIISRTLNGSQLSCSICSMSVQGGYAFFGGGQ